MPQKHTSTADLGCFSNIFLYFIRLLFLLSYSDAKRKHGGRHPCGKMGKANGRKNQLPCKPDEIVEGSTADDESETFVAVQESEDRPEEKDLHSKLTTWKKSS